jgi:hypothetical protein
MTEEELQALLRDVLEALGIRACRSLLEVPEMLMEAWAAWDDDLRHRVWAFLAAEEELRRPSQARCVLCGNPSPRLDPAGVCAACRMPAQVPPPEE